MATLYGDTRGILSGKQKGAPQVLVGTDDESNLLYGDAGVSIIDSARGGSDVLKGGDNSGSGTVSNDLFGDAVQLFDFAQGGNDELTGGDNSGNGIEAKPSSDFALTGPSGSLQCLVDSFFQRRGYRSTPRSVFGRLGVA